MNKKEKETGKVMRKMVNVKNLDDDLEELKKVLEDLNVKRMKINRIDTRMELGIKDLNILGSQFNSKIILEGSISHEEEKSK